MDLYYNFALIKGENKTDEIKCCYYKNNLYQLVCFDNPKVFHYNYLNVVWYTAPIKLSTADSRILINGELIYNVDQLLRFNNFLRVFFSNDQIRTYPVTTLTNEKKPLTKPKFEPCLGYFKKLANLISPSTDNDTTLLSMQYEKIGIVEEKTALFAFFSRNPNAEKKSGEQIYFPFRYNLNQINAVAKALTNNISVIEDFHGTGKIKTILNIIANVTISNKNVEIVSLNNSATINIGEKPQYIYINRDIKWVK